MHSYTARILALVGERSPVQILEETPDRLQRVVATLGPAGLQRSYAAGKWTASEILCHLADVEMVLGFRLRQALAEENHHIQPIEQDDWARRYSSLDPRVAVGAQRALRNWNLELIRQLRPEDLRRVAHHPERGEESVEVIVKLLAGHDLNHLAQLESIPATAAAR